MKRILYVILVLILALVILRTYFRPSFLDGFAGSSDLSLMIFKADWCGHCQAAMEDFKKLEKGVTLKNGSHVSVRLVDGDSQKSVVKEFQVAGFPTIMAIKGGQRIDYPGKREYQAIVDWLETL